MGEHKRIPLTRIHLEEDVGKLNHGGGSLIDFNRAGTPLMEIVSEPGRRSADEAFAFLTALKAVMIYGGISDCDMEKGQLRCDANVSIRPVGETALGTKVELKNLNSISFVRDGISHEIARQLAVVGRGGKIVQETRLRRPDRRLAVAPLQGNGARLPLFPRTGSDARAGGRGLEGAAARRVPGPAVRQAAPVFWSSIGAYYTITSVLVPDRALSDYFEEAVKAGGKPQAVGNWIANDLLRELGQAGLALGAAKVRPAHVAGLVQLVEAGAILGPAAKEVFVEMFATGEMPETVVERKGLKAGTDLGELEQWCREAIAANPKSLADFKSGKDSAINGFKGSVMRAAKGKADPKQVDETLRRLLGQM